MHPRHPCHLLLSLLLAASFVFAMAQPATGFIQIVSAPGVRVFVDGRPAGRTTRDEQGLALTNVPVGTHKLRFEKEGFRPHQAEVSVTPGEIAVYTLYSPAPDAEIEEENIGESGYLEPKTGVIELTCLPVYCSVSIPELELHNHQKQSSALTIREALAARYEVRVRSGDAQLRKTVTLEPDTTLKLFANFAGRRPRLTATVKRTPASVAQPYTATLERPLAVLIDNADTAYPQQGLVEASSVLEFPVEGGRTTLMSVYTRADPVQIGPLTSARDYFLEAALAMNGTLVHVGGAPSTVGRIASQDLATLDALEDIALFAEAPDRSAPHNVFSTGTALREAVGRLPIPVSGLLYTPPADAPDAAAVTVRYSAEYSSGFRYVTELDQYHWVRSGADATDTAGTALVADAVVVASVVAFPYPDDQAGRLYLPYTGGAATLYLRGKAVPGSWTPANGFTFVGMDGAEIDLTPFKSWTLFVPEGTVVDER